MTKIFAKVTPVYILRALSKWKLNASNEDMIKLFFSFPGFDEIENGNASLVLGRKGSGKTAICSHLSKKTGSNRRSVILSFKDFPFNQLYKLADDTKAPASQYVNVWKLIILSATCWLLSKDSNVGYQLRRKLATHFSDDPIRALSSTLTKWTTGKIDIPDFGFGAGGATVGREHQENDQSLGERVARLEEFVLTNMPKSEYFILFDNLHEDYSGDKGSSDDSEYFRILTGLISATTGLSLKFKDQSKKIRPIAFVRDDIYERLQHSDKNHWEDQLLRLNWEPAVLWAMVSYRICAEAGVDYVEKAFAELIDATASAVSKITEKHVPLIDYMMELTQYRPRDLLMLLKIASADAIKRGSEEIQTFDITSAKKTYSPYLKQEFEDEVHLVMPNYWSLLNGFEKTRRGILSYDELVSAIVSLDPALRGRHSAEELVELLYDFGIIGVGHEKPRFKYMDRATRFGAPGRVLIHPGLRASLGFV